MRNRPYDLPRWLVLPLPLIGHLPQQVVFRPGEVGHFHDHLRPHPVHARQLERRAEAAVSRRRRGQRHLRHLRGASTLARRFSSLSVIPVPAYRRPSRCSSREAARRCATGFPRDPSSRQPRTPRGSGTSTLPRSRGGTLHPFCGTRALPKEAPVDGSALAPRVLPGPFAFLRKTLTFNSPDPSQISHCCRGPSSIG